MALNPMDLYCDSPIGAYIKFTCHLFLLLILLKVYGPLVCVQEVSCLPGILDLLQSLFVLCSPSPTQTASFAVRWY